MAGRGRGRGGRGGGLTFNTEVLGFGRGDALPPPTLQPPPIFPTLEYNPVPLTTGEDRDYMLLLKQEFRSGTRNSPYFIKAEDKKKEIQRYSDKYHCNGNSDSTIGWTPDWQLLPKELKIHVRKLNKDSRLLSVKPNILAKKAPGEKDAAEVTKKLEDLEKKEEEMVSGDEEEKEENEEEIEDDELYDEEDQEEGTDYISTYFDPGEDYAVDEDDGIDDGPTY